jgi:TPR repeat protein
VFIFYSGWGLMVLGLGAPALLIGIWAEVHHWIDSSATPLVILSIWAASCLLFGRWVNSSANDRRLFDPDTQEHVILKTRHSLYGIHIEYWGLIILAVAGILLYSDIQSGKVDLKSLLSWAADERRSETAPSDDVKAGYEAYNNKKYADALRFFSRAADRGEAGAQFAMGLMLANGLGVDKDYAKALDWFRKAAAQGNSDAQTNIGYLYANGWGVPQDYQKSMEWYRKAADAGDSTAQYNLAMQYLDGDGTPKNPAEAAKWLSKAAAGGDEDAKKVLAEMQQAGNAPGAAGSSDAPFRYAPGKISIVFKDAVPGGFENGHATSCALMVNVHNNTKYHLNQVSFKIGDWSFVVDDELNANTYIDDYRILNISLSNGAVCSYQATHIQQAVKTAAVFDCAMPGIAEGDCQELVVIANGMDAAVVKRINDLESALGAKQTAPICEAIVKAGLDKPLVGIITNDRLAKFAALLDTLVKIDSPHWSSIYKVGSMSADSVVDRSPDGSTVKLKGHYRMEQGPSFGQVVAVIENGALKCLEVHFDNECRTIWLPDVSANQ